MTSLFYAIQLHIEWPHLAAAANRFLALAAPGSTDRDLAARRSLLDAMEMFFRLPITSIWSSWHYKDNITIQLSCSFKKNVDIFFETPLSRKMKLYLLPHSHTVYALEWPMKLTSSEPFSPPLTANSLSTGLRPVCHATSTALSHDLSKWINKITRTRSSKISLRLTVLVLSGIIMYLSELDEKV